MCHLLINLRKPNLKKIAYIVVGLCILPLRLNSQHGPPERLNQPSMHLLLQPLKAPLLIDGPDPVQGRHLQIPQFQILNHLIILLRGVLLTEDHIQHLYG